MDNIKIDSFKLRILKTDLSETDLPSNLNREIISIFIDSGEVVNPNEVQTKTIANTLKLTNDDGITSVSIGIEQQRVSKQQSSEFVTLKITSKLLKKSYYNGINAATIKLILEYLQSVRINIDMPKLLSSEITDIDFCKDVVIPAPDYKQLVEKIHNVAIPSKQQSKGYNIFNQRDNKGIEFSSRNKATPTNPFFKIYNKYLDSYSKAHSDFFTHYGIETTADLHRIEFTLKNKKHFEKYGLNNTLESFLNLTQPELTSILESITDYHINKSKGVEMSDKQDMIELLMEQYIKACFQLNMDYDNIKNSIFARVKSRATKHRNSNKMDDIYYQLSTMPEIKKQTRINDLMKKLCLA